MTDRDGLALFVRLVRLVIAAGIVVALVVAALFFAARGRADVENPLVQGKHLRSWLHDLYQTGQEAELSRRALAHAGTNIVPALFAIRFQPDRRWDLLQRSWIGRFNPGFRPRREAERYEARSALMLLGTNAANSLLPLFGREGSLVFDAPGSTLQLDRSPVNRVAEVMLFDLQTNAVPALVRGLKGTNSTVHLNICYILWSRPTKEVHANPALAQQLSNTIFPLLRGDSPAVICMALQALGQLAAKSSVTEEQIDSVTALLRHPHSGVRYSAAMYCRSHIDPNGRIEKAIAEAMEREKSSAQDDALGPILVGTRSKAAIIDQLEQSLKSLRKK